MRPGIARCALVLGICACTCQAVTFTDSFTPAASSLWSNTRGNWTASGGKYFAQAPGNIPPTYSGLPFDMSDCVVEVDVNAVGDGGLWLHSDGAHETGILLVTGGLGYGQGVRGGGAGSSLYYHEVHDGGYGGAIALVGGVFTPGQDYHLKVVITGNQYSVFIDGSATPALTFTNNVFPHGQVGLYDDQPNTSSGGFGPAQTFSNFSVTYVATPVRADFNNDVRVNTGDFSIFRNCTTGRGVRYDLGNLPSGCTCGPWQVSGGGTYLRADLDNDSDVDAEDFGIFQRCYSGIVFADPTCDTK